MLCKDIEETAIRAAPPDQPALPDTVTYTFDGRIFVVKPVFKETSGDSVGSILLRLMQSELDKDNVV
jgi:hypothetical protein